MTMKKIKTSEATGAALDWLVAKCEGKKPRTIQEDHTVTLVFIDDFNTARYSTDWAQGGPIIEREELDLCNYTSRRVSKVAELWLSTKGVNDYRAAGPTPLIAAMRCFVASKLGDEVEVPEELL